MTENLNATIREQLAEVDPDMLLADGFESALIGYVEVFSHTVALYDRSKCITQLMLDGMTAEEAEEYFNFNVTGAYVGDKTPAFATLLIDEADGFFE